MKTTLKIVRQAMNTDRAHAFGLCFKLAYVVDDESPRLEVFVDNEITRALDWAVYGTTDEHEELRCEVKFSPGQYSRLFELEGKFRIDFTGQSEQEVVYAKSGPTMEKAYHFEIEAVHPN